MKSLSRQLEQANQRFEVGLSAITDVQEAQAGYDLAIAQKIQPINAVDNAKEEVTGWCRRVHGRRRGHKGP